MSEAKKQLQRRKRHKRVRSRVRGSAECPRFCIFRSNKYIYAQLIDDERGRTLVAADTREIIFKTKKISVKSAVTAGRRGKTATAFEAGRLLGQRAAKKKIKKVVFDRGGYKYHGRVRAVAEGAREQGLQF